MKSKLAYIQSYFHYYECMHLQYFLFNEINSYVTSEFIKQLNI